MKVNLLDRQMSVSDQLSPEDVQVLAEQGVKILVCNRPDHEVDLNQSFAMIQKAGQKHGMDSHHLPFVGDQVEGGHEEKLLDLLDKGDRLHAYCRSGSRSSKLWARTRARQGIDPEELHRRASKAGFDVASHLEIEK